MVTTIATMNRVVMTRPIARWRRKLRWATPITRPSANSMPVKRLLPLQTRPRMLTMPRSPECCWTATKSFVSSVCASLGKNAKIAFNAFVFASGDRVR